MPGRPINNVGFMLIGDLGAIEGAELRDRPVNEFPRRLEKARETAILAA